MSRPANNVCSWSKLYVRNQMFKWKRLSLVKYFESKASLNSLMSKYVDELGISGSLRTLFVLWIRTFPLPKSPFLVAKSVIFFPRVVWWNSLLFSFKKGNWSLEHSIQNHWALSFFNKSCLWIYLVAFYVSGNVTNVTFNYPVISLCIITRKLEPLWNGFGS